MNFIKKLLVVSAVTLLAFSSLAFILPKYAPKTVADPSFPQHLDIVPSGIWIKNAAETSGLVFNNTFYYIFTNRNLSGSSTEMQVVQPTLDATTGQITSQTTISTFGVGYGCQDVLNDGGTVYVFATSCKMDQSHPNNSIVMFTSTDLVNWSGPTTILSAGPTAQFYNVSVTKNTDTGYTIVSYDVQSSAGNASYFLESNNYSTWTNIGGKLVVDGCADIHYLNGVYYIFFTDHLNSPTRYGTDMLETTDLTNFTYSRIPVLWPGYYSYGSFEDINTTDFDATEFNGRVYCFYLISDQSTYMRQTYGLYTGTMAQMIEAYQQPN